MSYADAFQVALREQARHKELVEALEARHGKKVAWVIRQHAEMLYNVASATAPVEYFNDPRVEAIISAAHGRLVSLIQENINITLIEFIFNRPMSDVEAKSYTDELELTLKSLRDSEAAILEAQTK